MKQILFLLIIAFFGCNSNIQEINFNQEEEEKKIIETIKNWNEGWKNKNVNLAIKDYANKTDWTNAFGDRVQNKEELRMLLEKIFNLDFVMAGNQNYVENDIEFVNEKIALVRSKNIRENQEWSDGTKMNDRNINHLRVYQQIEGNWLIISHMISQAHRKN